LREADLFGFAGGRGGAGVGDGDGEVCQPPFAGRGGELPVVDVLLGGSVVLYRVRRDEVVWWAAGPPGLERHGASRADLHLCSLRVNERDLDWDGLPALPFRCGDGGEVAEDRVFADLLGERRAGAGVEVGVAVVGGGD